jgi:hypothetical protein
VDELILQLTCQIIKQSPWVMQLLHFIWDCHLLCTGGGLTGGSS